MSRCAPNVVLPSVLVLSVALFFLLSGRDHNEPSRKPSERLHRASLVDLHPPEPLQALTGNLPASDEKTHGFQNMVDELISGAGLRFDALYDRGMLARTALAESNRNSAMSDSENLLPVEEIAWSMSKRGARAGFPRTFSERKHQLRLIQRMFSIAVDRIRSDSVLAEEFSFLELISSERETLARAAFIKAVENIFVSLFDYAMISLQLVIDMTQRGSPARDLDVWEELRALQKRPPSLRSNHSGRFTNSPLLRRLSLFHLDFGLPHYDGQGPKNGKFWTSIRPTLQCSSFRRLCSAPDGCRFLCNREYLLFSREYARHSKQLPLIHSMATESVLPRDVEKRIRQWNIVGFGSNNEFDWEDSLLEVFSEPSQSSTRRKNHIRSLTTFDCTIQTLKPSKPVAESLEFGFAAKCLDRHLSNQSIPMKALRNVLRQQPPFTNSITRRPVDSTNMFAVLALLKIDVEGYEFVAVPQWLRDDLASAGSSAQNSKLPHVDQLQMELHRMGHKGLHGASLPSALHAHLLLLHLHGLGFHLVGTERNHADNCCYETTFVHFRFFVLSEVWQALN